MAVCKEGISDFLKKLPRDVSVSIFFLALGENIWYSDLNVS